MKRVLRKSLSVLLSLMMIFSVIMLCSGSIKVNAAKQLNVTQAEAVKWVLDNYVNCPDFDKTNFSQANGGDPQCADLVKWYSNDCLGIAIGSIGNYDGGYGYVKNLKDVPAIYNNYNIIYSGTPEAGDIFVWEPGLNKASITGHTGIVVTTGNTYEYVDVNGSGGANKPGKGTASSYSYLIRPQFKQAQQNTSAQYTALVLDTSGSMRGTPLEKQKEAAISFCETLINASPNNYISIITFSSSATVRCDFINNYNQLKSIINSTSAEDNTNTNDALVKAGQKLGTVSDGKANKIIVLCSDGLPCEGAQKSSGRYTISDYDYSDYANAVYETAMVLKKSYDIYTLGFFHNLTGEYLEFGKRFMSDLQNEGFYNVNDPEQLKDTFEEIANEIVDPSTSMEELLERVLKMLKSAFSIMLSLLSAAIRAFNTV